MRLLDVTPICSLLLITTSAVGAPPAGSPATRADPDAQTQDRRATALSDLDAKLRFAPLWIPVPKYPPDPADSDAGVPSASYAMIWEPEWQNELGLSTEQREALKAIHAKALADVTEHTKHFKSLSREEQKAEVKSWGGKSAPWREQLDSRIRTQIESVLTREQLQTLKEYSFPIQAVGLLYDAEARREIGFGPEQEDRFRRVVKEKLARSQEEYLKQADKVWAMLNPQQQAELPEVAKRQGPTSAVLSIAFYVGFDMDAMESLTSAQREQLSREIDQRFGG